MVARIRCSAESQIGHRVTPNVALHQSSSVDRHTVVFMQPDYSYRIDAAARLRLKPEIDADALES